MKHIIYKIINKVNGKYYIGRHSTTNINDNYMGSGVGITNAISKYGKDNFVKEIIDEADTSEELWKLERKYVNEDVVKDKNSYNMCVGGKHYLMSLNKTELKKHQSKAGKLGARAYRKRLKREGKIKEWHSKGGKVSTSIRNEKYLYKIITTDGEEILTNGKDIKTLCEQRGWSYNTLAWKINKGPKTIKRGPLRGFYIEQLSVVGSNDD